MTLPMAAATVRPWAITSSGGILSSSQAKSAPGSMPQLPAVGAATTLPMAALQVLTDRAISQALATIGPDRGLLSFL